MNAFQPRADTIYLTDNGAAYCGQHLGTSARMTGRDISGQPIMPVTRVALEEARRMGWTPACEQCGKQAASPVSETAPDHSGAAWHPSATCPCNLCRGADHA